MTTLAVMATAPGTPVAGSLLTPPCTPDEVRQLAEAALADTLNTVRATPADRRVVVLEGQPGKWLPDGFDVVPQAEGDISTRLASAFADTIGHVREPTLLIGTNAPHVSATVLANALGALANADAALGVSDDGGYWALGLHSADRRVFEEVPMRTADTGRRQEERLRALGLRVASLPQLLDVDTFDDARVVAALAPQSWFAAAVRGLVDVVAKRDDETMPVLERPATALVVGEHVRPLGRPIPTTTPPTPVLDVAWGRLLASLFDPAAPPGRFASALLPDGVVGAGGAPERVLRRVGMLLQSGGRAIVELDPPDAPTGVLEAWLDGDGRHGPVPWTAVTPDTLESVAGRAGLRLASDPAARNGRWFATLEAP